LTSVVIAFILFIAQLMEVGTAEAKGDATVPATLIAAQKTAWNSGSSSV
jgi:hypothetical protein